MAIYLTQNDVELVFDTTDVRKFFACQALLSQRFLDGEDCDLMRRIAVREWSVAVRNGFVCC